MMLRLLIYLFQYATTNKKSFISFGNFLSVLNENNKKKVQTSVKVIESRDVYLFLSKLFDRDHAKNVSLISKFQFAGWNELKQKWKIAFWICINIIHMFHLDAMSRTMTFNLSIKSLKSNNLYRIPISIVIIEKKDVNFIIICNLHFFHRHWRRWLMGDNFKQFFLLKH